MDQDVSNGVVSAIKVIGHRRKTRLDASWHRTDARDEAGAPVVGYAPLRVR